MSTIVIADDSAPISAPASATEPVAAEVVAEVAEATAEAVADAIAEVIPEVIPEPPPSPEPSQTETMLRQVLDNQAEMSGRLATMETLILEEVNPDLTLPEVTEVDVIEPASVETTQADRKPFLSRWLF